MKKKENKYDEIIEKISELKKDDIVCITSDIISLVLNFRKQKEIFDPNKLVDAIIKKIGSNGTLLIPSFNWDFCKGKKFDYYKTPSQTGSLSSAALKRKDFKRTKHPVYSFAVWGRDQKYLCNLNNISAYGNDSPFSYLYSKSGKYFFIGFDYRDRKGFTVLHHFEERIGVNHRFFKNFKSLYIDEKKKEKEIACKIFVRDLKKNFYTAIKSSMDKKLIKNNGYQKYLINDVKFSLVDIGIAGKIIIKDLKTLGGLIYLKKTKN